MLTEMRFSFELVTQEPNFGMIVWVEELDLEMLVVELELLLCLEPLLLNELLTFELLELLELELELELDELHFRDHFRAFEALCRWGAGFRCGACFCWFPRSTVTSSEMPGVLPPWLIL